MDLLQQLIQFYKCSDVYKGSFNIVDDEIHFTQPPRGNPQIDKTSSNLDYETSSFNGRVFLKSNYDNNKVYDDISDKFTGIGRTFTLTVGGANTQVLEQMASNGLVFINNIYQSPKTDNNPTIFNYEILENTTSGITTVEFSGITRPDNPLEYVWFLTMTLTKMRFLEVESLCHMDLHQDLDLHHLLVLL